MSGSPEPQEEKFRNLVEIAASLIGWLAGVVLTLAGLTGAVYCVLFWTSFLFGLHYFVGMVAWRALFFLSVLLIFAGVAILRSAWKMRKEEMMRRRG